MKERALLLGDGAEGAFDVALYLADGYLGGYDIHLARLDLGQVEDVVDQVEQIRTGVVNRAGELDLLIGKVPIGVIGQQLGQDQQRVERRAQLV